MSSLRPASRNLRHVAAFLLSISFALTSSVGGVAAQGFGIGPLPHGTSDGAANGINLNGQIVGEIGGRPAFWLTRTSTPQFLPGSFTAALRVSEASGINQLGQIVGFDADTGIGLFWPNPITEAVGIPAGNYVSIQPRAINTAGHIVGSGLLRPDGNPLPLYWTSPSSPPVPLGAAGFELAIAFGVNDADQIVGAGLSLVDGVVPLLWTSPTAEPRELPAGVYAGNSAAFGINNRGEIVGGAVVGTGGFVPLFWVGPAEPPVPLPMDPYEQAAALAINDFSVIVGAGFLDTSVPVIWSLPNAPPDGGARLELTAVRDTFVLKDQPNANEGASELLRVQDAGKNRALVAFDLSGIDASRVNNAVLVLTIAATIDKWETGGSAVDAHPLLADWTEGTGRKVVLITGLPSVTGTSGVTWNCPTDALLANLRADCAALWNGATLSVAAATGPPVVHQKGLTGEVSWDVTADVRAGAVSGWLVKKRDESHSGRVLYYSREGAALAGEPQLAPRLIIELGDPTLGAPTTLGVPVFDEPAL